MSVEAILRDLTTRGITLTRDGDRLDIDGPEDALTDELLDQLREHKTALLELLTTPGRCPICHEPMNLQDKARDCWFCPGCRTWHHGDGSAYVPPLSAMRMPTTANIDWTTLREEMRMISPEIFERHNFLSGERRYLLWLADDLDRHTAWRYSRDSADLYPMTSGWRERATHIERRYLRQRAAMRAEAAAQRRIALDKEMLAATGVAPLDVSASVKGRA